MANKTKSVISVPFGAEETRTYQSHIVPPLLQFEDSTKIEDQDQQEIIDFLKKSNTSILQSGWARTFDPKPEEKIDVQAVNEAFFDEAEEIYSAIEASRWYPIDHVLARVEVSKASENSPQSPI